MNKTSSNYWICILFILEVVITSAYMVGTKNPYHQAETLDPRRKYHLEWKVNWEKEKITFSVLAETTGYVGFGLSADGKQSGADMVIGGILKDGDHYFGDYHAAGLERVPIKDEEQNWDILAAWENATHTFLKFSRKFETCDEQDYLINEDRITLLWAYGEKDDDSEYHHQNRGIFYAHLLSPSYTPQIIEEEGAVQALGNHRDARVWTIATQMNVPENDTTYWCTMHRPPILLFKHHIIGFQIRFDSEESRQHIYHMLFFRCNAPEGASATILFGQFVGQAGQECVGIYTPTGPMPTDMCIQQEFVWGVGGKPFFLPPHMGVPVADAYDEFYMLQVHYDNPVRRTNLVVNFSVDFFYTRQLREYEVGLAGIAHSIPGLPPSILIPPSSIGHTIYGHCAPECTRGSLPETGVHIGAVFLHSHNSGRSMRLQHFRKGKELPWITSDGNYGFNFQSIRALNEDAHVLPGDQLTLRCDYDNTWTNGSVVGGFSTRQEMCVAFVYYYNRLSNFSCSSGIDSEQARLYFLGARNVTWDPAQLEFIAQSPPQVAGLRISEISDNRVSWTLERRAELQRLHQRYPQVVVCRGVSAPASEGNLNRVSFPEEVPPYHPPEAGCSFKKSVVHP